MVGNGGGGSFVFVLRVGQWTLLGFTFHNHFGKTVSQEESYLFLEHHTMTMEGVAIGVTLM